MGGMSATKETAKALAIPGKVTRTGLQLPKRLCEQRWREVGLAVAEIGGSIQWWIGDWWRAAKPEWGAGKELCDELELDYQTVHNAASVAKSIDFSRRREKVPWTAHEAVAALPAEQQDDLLAKAEDEGWTRADMRAAVKELRRAEFRETNAAQELEGRFSLIYADPPWQYGNTGLAGSAEGQYPTMPTDAICAMPVAEHATDNAVLLLWVTNPLVPDALRVCEAWGFEYKTQYVWVKNRGTPAGFHVRARHEQLWVCTRGKGMTIDPSDLPDSVIEAPVGRHSEKPEQVYELIDRLYDGSAKLEMFARARREGWSVFGNEV